MPDEILSFRFQNLHEFVKVARQNLDRNNWDYLIGGSESETTLARNRLGPDSLGFPPRGVRGGRAPGCPSTRLASGRGCCATSRTSIAAAPCSAENCACRYCARRSVRCR